MRYDLDTRNRALTLLRDGVSNAEVSRRLGIPSGTVAWWLHRDRARNGGLPGAHRSTCHTCHGDPLDRTAYGYLLGLYLGDGHIFQSGKHRVPNLTIACCEDWPGLIDAAEDAVRRVFPHNSPCRVRRVGCTYVKVYSKHLDCHFPQHGPGKKHTRHIQLAPWQREIVDEHPWELIRGLVHSDGCRITNWTTRRGKRYEYPRYFFTNVSDDIRRIYTDALDRVGIAWKETRRGSTPYNISVARRESVQVMDVHVGPKF
ncbi:RNA polymerase sigma factor sigma-70 region 4 domain-containing protein [Streptacidiphilus fuscans]|uniref:Sigma-70 region 4 domain-containing protein n=1 Tax=Streptacidiphilus fuscans TaxID=2789292 RepID=A0A931B7J2_9ACTN|nr:sigma-70 region 4 domain-containing protein [Streptacidiphilus fuscans]MBF9070912.1 sigma-70 region 4 domain-containing protein [Streptacidiphilus fuscans]